MPNVPNGNAKNTGANAALNTQEPAANGNAKNNAVVAANGNAKNNAANGNANKNNALVAAAAMNEESASQTSTAAVNGSQNANANAQGGRRRTKRAKRAKSLKGGKRRISKGASKWNQFVMRTFKEMRKKNKTVKLMDAMKECAKQKKKGVKY